jgi:ribulose-5-phosphate 4-epimerase/fuculose-1-phosphate aldolase
MVHPPTGSRGREIPDGITDAEWQVRCDLAASYRLSALWGWTDLNNTHISARMPGSEDTFLLNPFGVPFEEITASSLVKVDHDGRVLSEGKSTVNRAGVVIHSAIYSGMPQLNFAMHTHSLYGTAVSMQKSGLLPVSQKALSLMGWLAYHDYEGPASYLTARPRLVNDLGDKRILMLRNHGLLTVGETMGEAFVWMYRIENACRLQITAMTGGAELQQISEEVRHKTIQQGLDMYRKGGRNEVGREWAVLLRQLENADGAGYRS